MALRVGTVIELLRTVDRLLNLERKHGDLIEAHARRLADRIAKLESREEVLISEAKGAASGACARIAATTQHRTFSRRIALAVVC